MRIPNKYSLAISIISLVHIIRSQNIDNELSAEETIRYYDLEDDLGSPGDFLEAIESPWFVDKTQMIEEFIKFNYIQITAPHRFGKSTNLSMLRYFFDITLNEADGFSIKRKEYTEYYRVFTDPDLKLSISANKYIIDKYLGEFIVIYFSLNRIFGKTLKEKIKDLHRTLQEQVFDKYAKWFDHRRDQLYSEDRRKAIVLEKLFKDLESVCDADIKIGLAYLVESLKKYYHKEVILLVDEFDSPAMNSLLMNEDPFPITRVIHTMICGVLKTAIPEHRVYRALFTGIYSSIALSCGSHLLNSVVNLPFLKHHEFAKFYGFLPHEVEQIFKRNNIPDDEETKKVIKFYKGYVLESVGTLIYNPIPIIRYIEERQNGTPAALESCCMKRGPVLEIMEEAMSHYTLREIILKLWQGKTLQIHLLSYDVMEYKKLLKAVFNKENIFLNYIYHNGYLTHTITANCYKIPNSDIRREFEYAIRSFYKGNNVNLELVGSQLHDILNYNRTLSRIEKNHVKNIFEEEFRKFINNIKRSKIRIDEKEISSFFHVASLLVPSQNLVEKEYRTVKIKNDELNNYFGRIDLMLVDQFNVTALIVEFKYKGVLRSALMQAEGYKITHRFPVKNIFFIAISIDKKLNVKLDVKFVNNSTDYDSSFKHRVTVKGSYYRKIRAKASMIRYYKKIRTTCRYEEDEDGSVSTVRKRINKSPINKLIKKIGALYYCPFCKHYNKRKRDVKSHITSFHANASKLVPLQSATNMSKNDIKLLEE